MKLYSNQLTFDAAPHGAVDHDVVRALFGLQRGVAVGEKSVTAKLTTERWLEIAKEDDGSLSAWVNGDIYIAGRVVTVSAYLGGLDSAREVGRLIRKAKPAINEAINGGSRAMPSLGKGRTASGKEVFLYCAPGIDLGHAAERLKSLALRNRIAVEKSETPAKEGSTPAKKAAKKSSELIDVASFRSADAAIDAMLAEQAKKAAA